MCKPIEFGAKDAIQFHQQNCTQLYQYTQLEVMSKPLCSTTFYAMCQKYQRKSTGTKAAHKMMLKLTPGVNFANVLQAAFLRADPKSTTIKLLNLTVFFVLLGSAGVKAAHKMKLKLTLEEDFHLGYVSSCRS